MNDVILEITSLSVTSSQMHPHASPWVGPSQNSVFCNHTPPLVQATPMSKQHWALVPSIFALLILAVCFSTQRFTVCHVCFLVPCF